MSCLAADSLVMAVCFYITTEIQQKTLYKDQCFSYLKNEILLIIYNARSDKDESNLLAILYYYYCLFWGVLGYFLLEGIFIFIFSSFKHVIKRFIYTLEIFKRSGQGKKWNEKNGGQKIKCLLVVPYLRTQIL